MPTQEKAAVVAELAEAFRDSTAAVLTEYRGLTVAQLTELRRALVRARTLLRREEHPDQARRARGRLCRPRRPLLSGPTAIAFVEGDPVEAAKGLRDFAQGQPALVVKGGVLDGRTLDARRGHALADLESREVLLAKLAGAMKANLTKAAGLFNAPLSQAARLAARAARRRSPPRLRAEAPADEAPPPTPLRPTTPPLRPRQAPPTTLLLTPPPTPTTLPRPTPRPATD